MCDSDDLLGTYVALPFDLADAHWPTLEHYWQALRLTDARQIERLRSSPSPADANRLGRRLWWRRRRDWKRVAPRQVGAALWLRCQHYPAAAEALRETGERPIIETSQYDYFWGCGRDGRGENIYGRVLMELRGRLR